MAGPQTVVATVVEGTLTTSVVPAGGTTDASVDRGDLPELTGDELFPVYSVTKTLIAAAVLSLVEQERTGLDDPVVIPGRRLDPGVTVRRLLNHTAGLPDYPAMPSYASDLRADPTRPWTRDDFLSRAAGNGLRFEPGTSWAYSNVGYLLLALLLEDQLGAPLADVLRARLIEPLGLERTRVAVDLADMADLTPARTASFEGDVPTRYHPGWVAHGLVLSTATELAVLVDAIFAGRLLRRETVDLMAEPVVLPFAHPLFSKPGYGLGLMVDAAAHGLVAGHGGGGPGYSAGAVHVASGGRAVTAVALANTEVDVGLGSALEAARGRRGG
ncbi:MAG TPA: serine hydrolase domain-containing protein [Nocardioidaceae bacterium]|nr:serine hydrolase domain-containing protein [Nocardioidaceae bacterium]